MENKTLYRCNTSSYFIRLIFCHAFVFQYLNKQFKIFSYRKKL